MFVIRFDMRAPGTGASNADQYEAAIEMTAWAEGHGASMAFVCEHHGTDDGYLPSPLVLATALAARTSTLRIMVTVVVLPFYDPVRLAEDMVVLDLISRGRVSYVAGVGYRPEEYEHHGVDFHRRGRIAEEHLGVLLQAKTGAAFVHDGRRVRVTPAPYTAGGPRVAWGGGSVAAVRRAGRHGIGFFGQGGDPEALAQAYAEEARAHGHEPKFCFVPPPEMPTTIFVSDDVDAAWEELGPYLLHEVSGYSGFGPAVDGMVSVSGATTVEQLRAANRSHRILTVDEAVELVRFGMPLTLQPLAGGLPPEIGWRYLRTVVDEVVPRVTPTPPTPDVGTQNGS